MKDLDKEMSASQGCWPFSVYVKWKNRREIREMRQLIAEHRQHMTRLVNDRAQMEKERSQLHDRLKMALLVRNIHQQQQVAARMAEIDNQITIRTREIEGHQQVRRAP